MDESTELNGKLPIEPPNGTYPARVDEKGRLKVPVGFQEYFKSLPENKFFVTSLDRRIGQLYPIAIWRKNKQFFSTNHDQPAASQNVAFNANDLGSDTVMDSQGRFQLSPELRRALGIENQPVKIYSYKNRVEIFSEAVYDQMRQQATQTSTADVMALERAGFE